MTHSSHDLTHSLDRAHMFSKIHQLHAAHVQITHPQGKTSDIPLAVLMEIFGCPTRTLHEDMITIWRDGQSYYSIPNPDAYVAQVSQRINALIPHGVRATVHVINHHNGASQIISI